MKLWEMAKKRSESNLALFSNKLENDEHLTEFEMYYLAQKKYIDSMFIIKYGERDFFTRLCDDQTDDILTEYSNVLQGHLLANNEGYKRIWSAFTAEYNPIENYNRIEEYSSTNTGDTSIKSGTDTTTNTGDISIKSGTDTDKNTKTGTEMFAKIGSEKTADTVGNVSNTTTDSKAPIDSTEYLPNNRTQSDTTQQSNTSILSFNERSDNHSFVDWNDTTTHTFDSKDSVDTTHTTTYNSKDSINTTTTNNGTIHGNIGITTSQQMINEEIALRSINFFDIIFKPIVLDYFY